MGDAIHSRNGVNGAPRREGLVRDIHNRGENLSRQLAQAGEHTPAVRIKVDLDRE